MIRDTLRGGSCLYIVKSDAERCEACALLERQLVKAETAWAAAEHQLSMRPGCMTLTPRHDQLSSLTK